MPQQMKKSLVLFIFFSVLATYFSSYVLDAQEIKTVTGKILNKTTGKPFDPQTVTIYTFNTVGEAEDALRAMKETGYFFGNLEVKPEADGYYETRVAETGALFVAIEGVEEKPLEKVNYRIVINFNIVGGNILPPSISTAQVTEPQPIEGENEIQGDTLTATSTIPLPDRFGKTNARLILQPILFSAETSDTIRYLAPRIYDGEQYSLTQDRRMEYDSRQNDPLVRFVDPDMPLRADSMIVNWADKIKLPDPSKGYYVEGYLQMEDYNAIYYNDTIMLASPRARRPLRFLEYSFDQYNLDPNKYKERAQKELRNTSSNISLNFLVNRAQIDEKDTVGMQQLEQLRTDLLGIVKGDGSRLTEFHLKGISSPDGSYNSNLNLAKARMNFAMSQITSVISRHDLDRIFHSTQAEVAPWSAVADILEADSLKTEAADVRAIIEQYPNSHDSQGIRIRRLPYYKEIISPRLSQLRTITYEYKYEINRELTPAEILDRYENDRDYRSGKKKFALYEYWHLFQMVKDKDELFELYKRAYNDSKEISGTPWALAANNYALGCLERGIIDTTILSPLINAGFRINIETKRADGTVSSVINPDACVANQIAMLLKSNNFSRASVLVQILPNTDRFRMIKALTMCLCGMYKGGRTLEEQQRNLGYFNVIANSTPRNKVVMSLAMRTPNYDRAAEAAIEELPQDEALTDYFKAIVACRNAERAATSGDAFTAFMEEDEAKFWLQSAISKDKNYYHIAESDKDITESVFTMIEEDMNKAKNGEDEQL